MRTWRRIPDTRVFWRGPMPALEALSRAGVAVDLPRDTNILAERGDARVWFGNVAVDIFCNSIPLHDSAMRRTRRVALLGKEVSILSAEDLTTLKMLFFRGKDLVDVEKILRVQGAGFDHGYVRGGWSTPSAKRTSD